MPGQLRSFGQFIEYAGTTPQISIANNVKRLLGAGRRHIQKIWPTTSPSPCPGLGRVGCSENKYNRFSLAPLDRIDCADPFINPVLAANPPLFEDAALTNKTTQVSLDHHERGDDIEIRYPI